jgi:hypothetical protein
VKVKIVSDGTRAGTTVVDADTGERVDDLRVIAVRWEIGVDDGAAHCVLTCRATRLEAVSEAVAVPQAPHAHTRERERNREWAESLKRATTEPVAAGTTTPEEG